MQPRKYLTCLVNISAICCIFMLTGWNSEKRIVYGDGVTDIDGNQYISVVIGNQEWMAEDLKTTRYNDGTAIPNITDDDDWSNLNTGAYAWYDNEEDNSKTYGALYNWFAVETGKLCPAGWHIPADEDWRELTAFLATSGHEKFTKGTVLKATGDSYEHGNGTDDYGFSALLGGYRWEQGPFYNIGRYCHWWSTTENNDNDAWLHYLSYRWGYMDRHYASKKTGFSVRCMKSIR